MDQYDWVDWLCEVWMAVGEKQRQAGTREAVADWEKLIDILGLSEYCISNAGDFENIMEVYPDFQAQAVSIAEQNNLPKTAEMFGLEQQILHDEFDQYFIPVCSEIKDFVAALSEPGDVGKVSIEWKPG
jgi:hypothetical protein